MGKPRSFLLNEEAPPEVNKTRSQKHEARLADELRARVQPGSGSLPFASLKEDLVDDLFYWQAKLTTRHSFSFSRADLRAVSHHAQVNGKRPGLAVTLEGAPEGVPKDWVAIPLEAFIALLDGEI